METYSLLPTYTSILNGERLPNYILCKHIPVSFNEKEDLEDLWEKHDESLNQFSPLDYPQTPSLLDLKRTIANRLIRNCHLCERRCRIDRTQKEGFCKVQKPRVASEFLHLGEERVLVPSYTVFFSGCTFHCVFCQNWDISQYKVGLYIEPEILARMIEKRESEGAKNVNWVGGDPTPNLPYILEVLSNCNAHLPQIWNSNMYCSIETMKLLNGIIDLYLTDFKYGNDDCAFRLSKVENYLKIVERNHLLAYEQTDVLVRHLVMPNHIDCCSIPVIKWLSRNLRGTPVNIMDQFRPEYEAYKYGDINRYPTKDEIQRILETAKDLGVHIID